MNIQYFTIAIILNALLFVSCSGSSVVQDEHFTMPYDMEIVAEDKIALVLSREKGTLSLFNMDNSSFYDVNPNVEKSQSIYIGGLPLSIAYTKKDEKNYDVYVATMIDSRWVIAGINITLLSDGTFTHSFLTLGDESLATIGDIRFINEDAKSEPKLTSLKLSDNYRENGTWILTYKSNNLLNLEMERSNDASSLTIGENIPINSSFNNDYLSFNIIDGFLSLDENDRFIFQSSVINPLLIDYNIRDIAINDDLLLILADKEEISYLLLFDTQNIGGDKKEITLSGNPSIIKIIDGQILLLDFIGRLNDAGEREYYLEAISNESISIDNISVESELRNYPIRDIIFDESDNLFFYIDSEDNRIVAEDKDTGDTISDIILKELPQNLDLIHNASSATFNYLSQEGTRSILTASTINGNIYLFDNLNLRESGNFAPIDAETLGSGRESKAGDIIFHDSGIPSNPKIKAIWTEDQITQDESWLLEFNSDIPFSESVNGVLDGNKFQDTTKNFNSLKLCSKFNDAELKEENGAYDIIIILDGELSGTTLPVLYINSDSEITVENDSIQSKYENLHYLVRAYKSYTVAGSVSGLQKNRVIENKTYESDNKDVSLFIQGSFINPTTDGDIFSFFTTSGVDPLKTGKLINKSAIFENGDEIYMYAMSTGSDGIYEIDLKRLRVKRKIK